MLFYVTETLELVVLIGLRAQGRTIVFGTPFIVSLLIIIHFLEYFGYGRPVRIFKDYIWEYLGSDQTATLPHKKT